MARMEEEEEEIRKKAKQELGERQGENDEKDTVVKRKNRKKG